VGLGKMLVQRVSADLMGRMASFCTVGILSSCDSISFSPLPSLVDMPRVSCNSSRSNLQGVCIELYKDDSLWTCLPSQHHFTVDMVESSGRARLSYEHPIIEGTKVSTKDPPGIGKCWRGREGQRIINS